MVKAGECFFYIGNKILNKNEKWCYTHVINIAQMGRHSNRFLQQKGQMSIFISDLGGGKSGAKSALTLNANSQRACSPNIISRRATRSSNK